MTQHANCVAAARILGMAPGNTQAAHKIMVGVTATPKSSMSSSQTTVTQGKNVNTIRSIGGKTLLEPGVRADGKPWEMTRDLDYAATKAQERVFAWLTGSDKINFDEAHRGQLIDILRGFAAQMQADGVARKDLPATADVLAFDDPAYDPTDLSNGVFIGTVTFYYGRGTQKVVITINSVFGG
jgi:hypothetical protein